MHGTEAENTAVQRVLDDLVADGREIGVQVAAYLGGTPIVDAWASLTNPKSGCPVDGASLVGNAIRSALGIS